MKKVLIVAPLMYVSACMSGTHVGNPWKQKAQEIPGRIECEFYDLGGEGIAF